MQFLVREKTRKSAQRRDVEFAEKRFEEEQTREKQARTDSWQPEGGQYAFISALTRLLAYTCTLDHRKSFISTHIGCEGGRGAAQLLNGRIGIGHNGNVNGVYLVESKDRAGILRLKLQERSRLDCFALILVRDNSHR